MFLRNTCEFLVGVSKAYFFKRYVRRKFIFFSPSYIIVTFVSPVASFLALFNRVS